MRARFRAVFAQELSYTLRRPLLWFMTAILLLLSWGMSTGGARISTGDASVGGTKAWITSEFSFAFILVAMITLVYSSPVPTASLLFGKVLANSLVGVVVLVASFLGGAIAGRARAPAPPQQRCRGPRPTPCIPGV